MKWKLLGVLVTGFVLLISFQNFNNSRAPNPMVQNYIFRYGEINGVNFYRIPSVVTVNSSGALIAFAEERVGHGSDSGDINVVYKISTDHGVTWGPRRVLCDIGRHTCGNPTAVVHQKTGKVHVFMNANHGDKHQFAPVGSPDRFQPGDRMTLYNRGIVVGQAIQFENDFTQLTYEQAQQLHQVHLARSYRAFDFVGPGVGIELQGNQHGKKGRLIVPAAQRNFISDDGGNSWFVNDKDYSPMLSETSIVELKNGKVLRNDRMVARFAIKNGEVPNNRTKFNKRRILSFSDDGGLTFAAPIIALNNQMRLLDPLCQGSMLRYTEDHILFSNCSSTVGRQKLNIKLTTDGRDWSQSAFVDIKCGYSSLAKTRDLKVVIAYEGERGSILLKKYKLRDLFPSIQGE